MSYVSDDFNAPNGSLSPNWSNVFPFSDATGDISAGGIQVLSDAFAPLSSPGNAAYACWDDGWGVASFGNNQWAQGTISAIAPFTSTVAITACVSLGGTSTYTYTLSTGAALVMKQGIYVTGMQNSGNNSGTNGFQVTGLGVGTFSVANASPGINEAGSSGTGISPSDSICGVAVRCTPDGLNCYVIQVGTNSGVAGNNGVPQDHRVYCVELWKIVAGVSTYVTGYLEGSLTTVPDKAGDVYTISAVGTVVSVYKNGFLLIQVTDTSLSSGVPGIGTWCVGGAGEWANPTVYTVGNDATQWTNFSAGDYVGTNVPYFDDFIAVDGTDLHTYNANWVENSGTFSIKNTTGQTGVAGATFVGSNALASWQGATFSNDQWAQLTTFQVSSANGLGPAVRVASSGNSGYFYRAATTTTRVLYKIVSGTYTLLGTSNTSHTNAVGDVLRLVVVGTSVRCYLNGTLESFGAISDSALTSGFPGMEGTSTVIGACFQCGNCAISGNMGVASASVALTGTSSATITADANGNYAFPSLADGSYTITPTKTGETFAPTSLAVTLVGGTLFPSGQNATGTAIFNITGNVGVSGVTVNYTGPASGSVTSGAGGSFTITGVPNGSYTIKPVLKGYKFSPVSQGATVSGGNVSNVNFTATAVTRGTRSK